jgi:hypothetical protein
MHAWEGNPRLDESSEYRSLELTSEGKRTTKSVPSRPVSWRVLAVLAAGSLLGVPFLATGTFHAVWAQISHMLTFLRR